MTARIALRTAVLLSILSLPLDSFAQGQIFINPPQPGRVMPPLATKAHRIEVEITDRVAVTQIDQTFLNQTASRLEGTYIFPVPKGVAISKLSMKVNDEIVTARVVDAGEARKTYEEIVRSQRDPALLEYVGRELVRLRVFPIEPNSETRVIVEYEEILPYDSGTSRYKFGFIQPGKTGERLDSSRVQVRLNTTGTLRSIYSPTHDIDVASQSDHRAKIGFSDENLTHSRDFELVFGVSPDDVALHLLTYRDDDDEDGYFMLLGNPRKGLEDKQRIAKRVVFVIDTSGSMKSDKKLEQAKEALQFTLQSLHRNDLFGLITFSGDVNKFSNDLAPASEREIEKAVKHVKKLEANGGTNIDEALEEALQMLDEDDERPAYVLFLTDGRPTEGVRLVDKILEHSQEENDARARIFSFGVGFDVNTDLLDRLATEHRGIVNYVRPTEDIEVAISSLYSKISKPVLSDPKLDFGKIRVSRIYPKPLPDLFAGQQLVILGRYREGGKTTVALAGKVASRKQSYETEVKFADESDEYEFIPRLWASRRIGYLSEQIQKEGEEKELVDEIKSLSKEFGIVTPWTSMLITEDMEQMNRAVTTGARLQRIERLSQRGRDPGVGAQTEAAEPLVVFGLEAGRNVTVHSYSFDGNGIDDDGTQSALRAKRKARPQADVQTNFDPTSSDSGTVDEDRLRIVAGIRADPISPGSGDSDEDRTRVVAGFWGSPDWQGYGEAVTDLGGVSGAAAVGRSMTIQGQLKEAKQVGDSMVFFDSMGRQQVARGVQQVGKTSFYQVGPAWVQAGFDFKAKDTAILKIKPFSQAYFDLLKALPELSKSLALGDLLYLHHRGHQIVVVEDGLDQITKKQLKALKKPI